MKYNYYNHTPLGQQAMKTLFRFGLYLLFALLLCISHKVHARETLPKPPAVNTRMPNVMLYTSYGTLACACLVASPQVTLSNKNGASRMAVTNPLWYNATDQNGNTAVFLSACAGHLPCVQYLQQQGADMNATGEYGDTALLLSVKNRHLPCLKYLIQQGADGNAEALDLAQGEGHKASCSLFKITSR